MDNVNDVEGWIYFDGPEPEPLRALLDDVRDLPPLTPEDKALMERRLFDAIDATLGYAEEPPGSLAPAPTSGIPSNPLPPSANLAPAWSSTPDSRHSQRPSQPLPPASANISGIVPAPVLDGPRSTGVTPSRPATPAAKTLELPVMGLENLRVTTPLENNIAAVANSIPVPGSKAAPATVHIPHMSIEQFAAFQAEVAHWPSNPDWVRPRHHVANEAAHAALDEHWHKHFAAHPEDWPAYSRAFAEWTANLSGPASKR